MKFNYQARTKTGEIQSGIIEASSREAGLAILQKYGFYVTYLEEEKPPLYAKKVKIFEAISKRDIVLFSRQLSIMFGSRVPLVEALRVLARQTENPELKEKILILSEEVEGGSAFSKALSIYPQIFSPFYISMVKAGEASGKLSESLSYLADHLEREYHLVARIRGALIYPALIILVVLLVLILMIYFVIPHLSDVILEGGQEIPAITQFVINFSNFFKKWGLFLILGLIIISLSLFRHYRTETGKKFFDKTFLKLPLLGPLLKLVYLSRFAENLSTLISGGLYISQALEICGNIVGNECYKEAVFAARDEVRRGAPISSILERFPLVFPPVFVQMVLVGEKTGTLSSSLMNIALFYQKEAERTIENILSILEPVLILILGLVVAGLMLSILMPLYRMIAI